MQGDEPTGRIWPLSKTGGDVRYDHERMDVYRLAIEFIEWRRRTVRRVPPKSDVANQLVRASSSIALNIAEGCGEESQGDRKRFFRYARRSASECSSALDVIAANGFETAQTLSDGYALLRRLRAMLTVLSR